VASCKVLIFTKIKGALGLYIKLDFQGDMVFLLSLFLNIVFFIRRNWGALVFMIFSGFGGVETADFYTMKKWPSSL